jgi:hypothetical protein
MGIQTWALPKLQRKREAYPIECTIHAATEDLPLDQKLPILVLHQPVALLCEVN